MQKATDDAKVNRESEANPALPDLKKGNFQSVTNSMSASKEHFIQETGGFRFLESNEDFAERCHQIESIRKKIKKGTATAKDIDNLAKLLGTGEDDASLV